jgi:hypothetical protein
MKNNGPPLPSKANCPSEFPNGHCGTLNILCWIDHLSSGTTPRHALRLHAVARRAAVAPACSTCIRKAKRGLQGIRLPGTLTLSTRLPGRFVKAASSAISIAISHGTLLAFLTALAGRTLTGKLF